MRNPKNKKIFLDIIRGFATIKLNMSYNKKAWTHSCHAFSVMNRNSVRKEDVFLKESRYLKNKLYIAFVTVIITLLIVVAVTFAWYIYNTQKHTTSVHMAAGAGESLQISNSYDGTYGQSTVLDEFVGTLNPVSTNRIGGGFQKVYGFTNGSENQPNLVASIFGESEATDYYKTSLFLRTNGTKSQVYISGIGYEDSDKENPISTAIRVGIVPHLPGVNQAATNEYFFVINPADNPKAEYNTATGTEGDVLDADKTDGTTVPMRTYDSDNYCNYNAETGAIALKPDSLPICELTGAGDGKDGESVQVDVYIWLEGCDKDCTSNLCNTTLKRLAVSFVGDN